MTGGELLGDRFEIDQAIDRGGMGTVFRAHETVTGEAVAIKILSEERSHVAERFAREVQVLAELSHPGIVRYIAHGATPGGQRFLAMEWVDGELLETRLQRGPLPTREAVALATRVADALGAASSTAISSRPT